MNKENLTIQIGFGFYHKESDSVCELTLKFVSRLRNEFNVRPATFIADGAYDVNKLIKRLTDYGWACVIRCRKIRKFNKTPLKKLIPRGFSEGKGELKNKTKVKVIRRKERYFITNRMLISMQKAFKLYTSRWKVEESFRFLKSSIS